MKIGILMNPHGDTYARFGKEKFQKIRAHGFDAVDYNMHDTGSDIYTCSEAELGAKMSAERADAAAAGLLISQVHGPWRYPPRDATEQDRAERMEKMKRSLLATHLLGCKHWVIHPLMPNGTKELETGMDADTRAINIAFWRELVPFAEALGVVICLENMPFHKFSISRPAEILEILRAVDSDCFQACLDTGHVAVFPELSIGEEVRRLGAHMRVMHVHDNMGDKDSHLWPTHGILNWGKLAAALREVGFAGVFSLETSPNATLDDTKLEAEYRTLCRIAENILK